MSEEKMSSVSCVRHEQFTFEIKKNLHIHYYKSNLFVMMKCQGCSPVLERIFSMQEALGSAS